MRHAPSGCNSFSDCHYRGRHRHRVHAWCSIASARSWSAAIRSLQIGTNDTRWQRSIRIPTIYADAGREVAVAGGLG